MIECQSFPTQGSVRLSGVIPNGKLTMTRRVVDGLVPQITLRAGDQYSVEQNGFNLTDTEGPLGVPLIYRALLRPDDRYIQVNLMRTPDFTRGAQAWAAGPNRTLTIATDETALSKQVGMFGANAGSVPLGSVPTLVGHAEGPAYTGAAHTLTPPTTGGTAIATGDVQVLLCLQPGAASTAAPALTQTGWTLLLSQQDTGSQVRLLVWTKVRAAGETGVTITPAVTGVLTTLLWFRGADPALILGAPATFSIADGATGTIAKLPAVHAVGPALAFNIAGADYYENGAPPASGAWADAAWSYNVGSSAGSRNISLGFQSLPVGGTSAVTTITYPTIARWINGLQITVLSAGTASSANLLARTFARVTTEALASPLGYRMSGRLKFTTADVWTWNDVRNNGTWQQLLNAKATWEQVRSSSFTSSSATEYSNLYICIANPSTGARYIEPIRVRGLTANLAHQWIDFSFDFTPRSVIPSGSEIWLMHGPVAREFAATWSLDRLSIVPTETVDVLSRLPWFSGDSTPPPDSADIFDPTTGWVAASDDAQMSWGGTPGNAPSYWYAPRLIAHEFTCQIEPEIEGVLECEPILVSDPVAVNNALWLGLLSFGELRHAGVQEVYRILGRSAPIVVGQRRSWEVGSITLMTSNLDQRDQLVENVIRSGRILLIRTLEGYVENNWYVALGDLSEARISPDQRNPMRSWSGDYVRVERPGGLIDRVFGNTWAEVKAEGTWSQVAANHNTWLSVVVDPVEVS